MSRQLGPDQNTAMLEEFVGGSFLPKAYAEDFILISDSALIHHSSKRLANNVKRVHMFESIHSLRITPCCDMTILLLLTPLVNGSTSCARAASTSNLHFQPQRRIF